MTGQYNSTGGVVEETVWLGDLPVAVLSPSGQFYIAPDHLGSPHQIADAGANSAWLWDHDPFGNGAPSGAFGYNLRFPGQFFDQRAKLHYNYFRDYDPNTGRYIESDPIGLASGINTYAYVGENPLTRVDTRGLQEVILPFPLESPWFLPPGSTFDPLVYPFPNTLESRGLPPGYWDAETGSKEWGKRNGIDPTEALGRFHKIKEECKGKGPDKFGVNPDTGEVVDPSGDIVGNLGE